MPYARNHRVSLSAVCMICYESTSMFIALSLFPWNSSELITCALDLEKSNNASSIPHPHNQTHDSYATKRLKPLLLCRWWDFHVEKNGEFISVDLSMRPHRLSCVPFVLGGSNGLWSALFSLHITHWPADFFAFFATFGSS